MLVIKIFKFFGHSGICGWHKYLTGTQVIKARVSIELYRNLHVFEIQSKTMRSVFLVSSQSTSHRAFTVSPSIERKNSVSNAGSRELVRENIFS